MARGSITTQAELWSHACELAKEHGYDPHVVYDLMLFGEDDDTVLAVLKVVEQSCGLFTDGRGLMEAIIAHERTRTWLREGATK